MNEYQDNKWTNFEPKLRTEGMMFSVAFATLISAIEISIDNPIKKSVNKMSLL